MQYVMQISIPYGSDHVQCSAPAGSVVLNTTEPAKSITPALFRERLKNQLGIRSVDFTRTVIIVADKTRVCGYPEYLELLIVCLREAGLNDKNLTFIIAYGTHPRQSDDECLQNYGEIYNKYPFIHHDCSDTASFVQCGTTSQNTPIRIRKDILSASCVITMGPICHHYFAGYGGGRKLIFPGCGEKEAIYKNHSLYLNRKTGSLSPNCQPGILDNNPLAEDLFEIAQHKEADIAIHGIMDSHGILCDVVVGSSREDYLAACRKHGRLCESNSPAFPVVAASCGGFPKDINFIQSHKAVHNASMFVEDGGTLIVFSECSDGIGSTTFLPWFDLGGFDNAFHKLIHDYQGNGGTALAMMTKTARIRIVLVTELDHTLCSAIGVEKWSIQQAVNHIEKLASPLCYIPNSSLLVKKQ